jgi:S1-C subfamily serine protease
MQISIQCPHCSAKLNAKDKLLGRELPCPKCGQVFVVREREPIAATSPVEEPPDESLDELFPKVAADSSEGFADGDLGNEEFGDLGLGDLGASDLGTPLGGLGNAYAAPVASKPQATPAPSDDVPELSNRGLVVVAIAGAGFLVLLLCGVLGVGLWMFSGSDDPEVAQNFATPAQVVQVKADTEPARSKSDEPPLVKDQVESAPPIEEAPSATGDGSPAGSAAVQPVVAPQGDVIDTLERLKAATVFIKVTTSKGTQTGSGFLLEVAGDRGVVVTNAHVIEPESGSLREINCVFRSGTREEFVVKAEVNGKDPGADLAVLTVKHNALPASIDSADDVKLRETSSVLVLGFPFGEILTTSSRNPAITVSKGTISSIRRDDYDNVVVLQIDGGINPGNSGGPTATEDGKLVGISVAKVRDADIGFAIPKRILGEALLGRVATISARRAGTNSREHTFRLSVEFIDPKQNIESATILLFDEATRISEEPEPDGRWKLASEELLRSADLNIQGTTATTSLTVPADQSGAMFQIRWKRKDGTEHFTKPLAFDAPNTPPTVAAARSRPTPPAPQDPRAAEVTSNGQVVMLSNTMADFALNPRTGDVAAVDPMANRAYLFREGLLADANADAAPELRLGETPVSIAYKRFGDVEVFAAVCTQDSHMYIIDANEFTRIKKIPLASAGISSVTGSSNPEDPFVYYNYGSGHDSAAGAVDLRKMVDCGEAFDDSMDCAISADGRVAYRRGPWSPSGFESLQMISEFSDPKPAFVRLFYDHRSTGQYVPDPFGEFTASHTSIYTAGLEKQVASLKFVPLCFFRTKPVLVGLEGMRLRAASYNTFSNVGTLVQLPEGLGGDAGSLPRGVRSQADFKRVGLKKRVLADDKNGRVVYAFRDKLALIPLSDFDLPDEPFMVLDVGTSELTVGMKKSIEIKTPDDRVTIEYGDLPEGMKPIAGGLEWTPQDEHVGTSVVPVTLSFDDVQRIVNLEVRVSQPSIESPIEIAGFTLDDKGTQAVCWTGPALDQHGRPIANNATTVKREHAIALIPLRAGQTTRKKVLAAAVKQAVVIGAHVAVLSTTENSRVEVYDTNSMERVKTLLSSSPLTGIGVKDGQLILQGSTSVDVYNITTFKRLRTRGSIADSGAGGGQRAPSAANLKDGVIIDGVLYNTQANKPKLIVAPHKIPALKGADVRLYSGSFLRRHDLRQPAGRNRSSSREGPSIVAGPITISGRGVSVSLENAVQQVRVSGATHTSRTEREVSLVITDATGARLSRVPIVSETMPQAIRARTQPPLPTMHVVGDKVFVAIGRRIFRWVVPSTQKADAPRAEEAVEFHVVPEQSTFTLRSQKTELKHTLKGGQAPYEYFLVTRLDGVTLDDVTGVATIDRDKVLEEAVPVLLKYARGASDVGEAAQRLQAAAIELIEPTIKILGRKPKGFPLAIPIHFKAIDDEGKVAEMQYFVIMEASYRQAAAKLKPHLGE